MCCNNPEYNVMVNSKELFGIAECLTLYTSCRINRSLYNRTGLYTYSYIQSKPVKTTSVYTTSPLQRQVFCGTITVTEGISVITTLVCYFRHVITVIYCMYIFSPHIASKYYVFYCLFNCLIFFT